MKLVYRSLCLFLISVGYVQTARHYNVTDTIKNDPDLSEFYSMLETNPVAKSTVSYRSCTVFVPTNLAFQHYQSKGQKTPRISESLVNYHISTQALTLDQFGRSVSSDLDGNPPLWITKLGNDVYVNNAKIQPKSNYQAVNEKGKKQVLHIIDQVLEPVLPKDPTNSLYNPSAFQFLNQTESLDIGDHRIRTFRQRVALNQKDYIFKYDGSFTFFIPVDEGFQPTYRADKIDQRVIDGHVIPNHVLFTSPTPQGKDYETLANEHMMKVTISMMAQKDGKNTKMYVKSNTVLGDQTHAKGVVMAEIVRANIPVKNGVIHLIDRPLMVVDSTVEEFLKEKVDGPLYRFYRVIMDTGGDFMNRLLRAEKVTLFAPSNAAWNQTYMEYVLADRARMKEILSLHMVETSLPTSFITQSNAREVPTSDNRRYLYFNVLPLRNRTVVTVEGGGVNATILEPDIAATNGVVHIIDRVLGVPFMTIGEKLDTDPMLNNTAFLGNRSRFNDRLRNEKDGRKFTYFVPRDYAWKKAEIQYPSAHKKLFMTQYSYHVNQILERHLVVHDKAYTMAELKAMSNDTFTLPTVRDSLKLKVKEIDRTELGEEMDLSNSAVAIGVGHNFDSFSGIRKGYQLEWRGELVTVFRPDVHCTNGIIHVIDRVLLKESDVRVNMATTYRASWTLPLLLLVVPFVNWY